MKHKKIFKKVLFIVVICLLLVQFYQPARNVDNGQVLVVHFQKVYTVPNNIATILQNSCYDCHSNNTNYRWYDYIQPARIMVEHHISNAKKDLNFSEWGNYSSRKQQTKLDRIIKQVKANEMPLGSYTLLHKNAILSTSQKNELINWLTKTADSLSANN